MDYKFDSKFKFGTSASGPQTEGNTNKAQSIWDYWYEQKPELFHNQIGPDIASDVYNQYKEDYKIMKKIGLNSHRTSIQWTRLLPDGINLNQKAVVFYHNLIDEMIANNVEPMINLFHFDMPMIFQEIGGWENKKTVEAYVYFAKKVFELYGNKVKYFTTFNEPMVHVECGYLYQYHYPQIVDFKRAIQVAFNTMLASAKAIEQFKKMDLSSQIGIILNLSPSIPKDENQENLDAANKADLLFNRSFLDPSVHGTYPQELIEMIKSLDYLPTYEQKDLECIKNNTIDFLGVNYYQPRRVKAQKKVIKNMPETFFDYYDMPNKKMNIYRGWEIYEKGLYDIAINIKENYNNILWYVSENGMGVENEIRFAINNEIQDDYRIEFFKEHLKYLHKAINEGSNCFAYHNWSFTDNWSWCNAYKNRYGLVSIDLKTQKRTLKKSAYFFQDLIKNSGFED